MDKYSWKDIKNNFKQSYQKLNLKEARLSHAISISTFILISSSFALIIALVVSIVLNIHSYITTYSILLAIVTICMIAFVFTLERNNLYSIVLVIWKQNYDFQLSNKLMKKLQSYIFCLSSIRYWFYIFISIIVWFIILFLVFYSLIWTHKIV